MISQSTLALPILKTPNVIVEKQFEVIIKYQNVDS